MEKQFRKRQIICQIKAYAWDIFIADNDIQPYLALILLYLQCLGVIAIYNYTPIIIAISLIGLVILKKSYFFLYGLGINKIGFNSITSLNMIIGLFSCNQKWKIYIYALVLGDFLERQGQTLKILTSLIICSQTLHNFSFKKANNFTFFIFSLILAFTICWKKIFSQEKKSLYLLILFIPLLIKVFAEIFKHFELKLINKQQYCIKNPQTAFHYIWSTVERFKQPYYRQGLIQRHKNQCNDPVCFCYSLEQPNLQILFEESLYESFLTQFQYKKSSCEYLYNKFIQFKIHQKKYFQALLLSRTLVNKPENIFRKVQRARNQQLLRKCLKTHQLIRYKSAITLQGLYCDANYDKVKQKINSILQRKISFFTEIGKPISKLSQLQCTGRKLIVQTQSLHKFFQSQVRPLQENVNNFKTLGLYLIYLIHSTNFKEEAVFLLKNAERNFKQTHLNESVVKETLTSILEIKKQVRKNKRQNSFYEIRIKNDYQMLFKKVSKSFCRLINRNQSQIIGKDINILIPQIYRKTHQSCVRDVLCSAKITDDSKLNGNTKQIFLNISQKQGKVVKMSLKAVQTNDSKLQFVCLINRMKINSRFIIINLEGQIDLMSNNINSSIISNEKIKEKISLKKEQWKKYQKIKNENFGIIFQEVKYHAQISTLKLQDKSYKPHILIQFLIQARSENINPQSDQFQQIDQHIHDVVQAKRDEQTQDSNSYSKRSSTNAVISNFLEKKIVRYFHSYLISLGISFLLLILLSTLFFTVFAPSSASDTEKSIVDFQISVSIQEKINQRLILWNNYRWYKQGIINTTFTQKVYGKVNFDDYIQTRMNRIYAKLQDIIFKNIRGDIDPQIGAIVKKLMDQKIMMQVQGMNSTFSLSANNLLINCVQDFNLLTQGALKPLQNNFLSKYYISDVRPILNKLRNQLIDYFKNIKAQIIIGNIALLTFFLLTTILLAICFYLFRKKYSKYRVNIYDLIVSVETKLLQKQINKLMSLFCNLQPDFNQEFKKTSIQRALQAHQANKYCIDEEIQEKFTHIEVQKDFNYHNQLRKRTGQLNLTGSQQQPYKIIWKKYILILLIISMLPLFITTVTLKIDFQNKLQDKVEEINLQHYLYRIAGDSTLIFQQICSSQLKQEKPTKMVDLQTHFKQGLYAILQFQKKKDKITFDNREFQCDISMRQQLICMLPFRQSSLMSVYTALIQQARKYILNPNESLTKYVSEILFYMETVLRQLQSLFSFKSAQLKQQMKSQLSVSYNSLIILYIIEIFCCFLIGFYGMFQFLMLKKQQMEEISILTILDQQMITSNKRIQSFLQKMNKKL